MAQEGSGGPAAGLPPADLLRAVGADAEDMGDLLVEPVVELARVNSWNVDDALLWSIARRAARLAQDPDVDGVVVTHGTDTIEETAFAADLLTAGKTPVVLVGAMRAADETSADGPGNLRTAVLAAASGALAGTGASVCLGDELHAARWVRKVHTRRPHAIASPDQVPLAVLRDGRVAPVGAPPPRWCARWPVEDPPPVPLVAAHPGMDPELMRLAVSQSSARGLVVEGYGLGHLPAPAAAVAAELVAAGVVVVVATRVPGGGAGPVYGGAGGGVQLQRAGVLSAGVLSAGKARLLLSACLSGADHETALARFTDGMAVLGEAPLAETEETT